MSRERFQLELRRARRPLAIYLAGAAAAAVALAVMLSSQKFQSPFQDTFAVRAMLDDAKGIVPGRNPVRIAGVEVGLIERVDLVRGQPVATLSIESRYGPVYRDARLRIRPVTAVQDLYGVLDRGTPAAGRLPDGAVIPAAQTLTPVDVSRVLQMFDAPTRARMHALIVGLGRGTADRGTSLRRAFAELGPFLDAVRRLSRELAVRRGAVARLVNRASELNGELATRDRALAGLVRDGAATLGALGRRAPALDAALAALPTTVRRADAALGALLDAQRDLDPALEALAPSIPLLEPALRSLERLAPEMVPALRGLRTASGQLAPMVAQLRPTTASLHRAVDALAPQAQPLDRATRPLPGCLDELRDFLVFSSSVGKFSTPSGGAIGRFEGSVGLDSAAGLVGGNLRRISPCTEAGG